MQDSRDRPVALEIFSGSRHMARALRRQRRNVTVFQLDISHGLQFDLAKKSIQQELIDFLASFHVVFVWLGTPSSSWSRARKNHGRGPGPLRDDDEFIDRFCDLSPKDYEKVKIGNSLMRFSARVFRQCIMLNIPVVLENPHTSRLWKAPLFRISYHIGTFNLDILIFAKMVRPGVRELESCGLASRSGLYFGNVLADMDFAPARGLAMSLGKGLRMGNS